MNEIVEKKPGYSGVQIASSASGGALLPQTFGDVVAFASVMARADLALPKHLRGNEGACMAVAMQAVRWGMDPFAVANKTYSVNDRLAYEAQLVAAVVHMRAGIKGRPNYVYSGEGATRTCKVICTLEDGEVREYETPPIGTITVKNSPLWKSDPDQQLGYFAIRSWARRYTPEVILGVYDRDEIAEAQPLNITPKQNTGLYARLAQTTASGEGFTAHNVIVGVDPADGPDTTVTAIVDMETGEVREVDMPVDEVPETFEPEYLLDWAQAITDALGVWKTKEQLAGMWGEPQIVKRFTALKEIDLERAKALHAAVVGRQKALKK